MELISIIGFFVYLIILLFFAYLFHLLLLLLGFFLVWKRTRIWRIFGIVCILIVAYYQLSWISPWYAVKGGDRVQQVSLSGWQFQDDYEFRWMDNPPRLLTLDHDLKYNNSKVFVLELNTRRTYQKSQSALPLDDLTQVKRSYNKSYYYNLSSPDRLKNTSFYAFPTREEPVSEYSFIGFQLPKLFYIPPSFIGFGSESFTGWKIQKNYFGWLQLKVRETESSSETVELNQLLFNLPIEQTSSFSTEWILGGRYFVFEPGQTFVLGPFQVKRKITHFLGTFSDRLVDSDSDGLFDEIRIAPKIKVIQPGTYTIFLTLTANNGEAIESYSTLQLTPGVASPEIKFATGDIKKILKQDAPYTISQVRLQLGDAGGTNKTIDVDYDIGKTKAYEPAKLQDEAIVFSIGFKTVGVDTNGNGKYDFLDVTIPLKIRRGDVYQWNTLLYDRQLNTLDSLSDRGFLPKGEHKIKIRFNGAAIGSKAVDGAYKVGFVIYNDSVQLHTEDGDFTTPTFTASQFEGSLRDRQPPQLSFSVTPTKLSPPTDRMVEIKINARVRDDVDPAPTGGIVSISTNDGQIVRGDRLTSPDIDIKPDGRVFLRAKLTPTKGERVYTLTYATRDRAGNAKQAIAHVKVSRP